MDRKIFDILFLPLEQALLQYPENPKGFFLRAQLDSTLKKTELLKLDCEQDFKPYAEVLVQAGYSDTLASTPGTYNFGLLLQGKQREENLYYFAKGMSLLNEGGWLLCAMPNEIGASRFERHLAELAGNIESYSRNRCRAFWALKNSKLNQTLLEEWLAFGELRKVEGSEFYSAPGFFSWEHADKGSEFLLHHIPKNLSGKGADFGAGWGYLALRILQSSSQIKELHLFEADRRALQAAQLNLESHNITVPCTYNWQDVCKSTAKNQFNWIVMNPPFHEGKEANTNLGNKFIESAARALVPGGSLYMVANRSLPYEKQLSSAFSKFDKLAEDRGFKVFCAKK